MEPQEFQNISVRDILFGREDEFINLISKVRSDIDPEDVCLLGYRDGMSKNKYTLNRGIKDIEKLDQFTAIDDKPLDTLWRTDKCNKIKGSNFAVFNSTAIHNKEDVFLFPPEIHRALPIHFVDKVINI